MRQLVTKPFPYFVGVYSLEELITKKSKVCVINILGNESRRVTPISHVYSGGNVVAGVQYGRRGVLETPIGEIPVYHSVRDVMHYGHEFDIGVIYLPPPAVSQAVWELVRFNKNLKRIVIVTEKVSTRDSRNIRYICQNNGVDVIGPNSLGILNAWDHVRAGGALGGDHPEQTFLKGSIAIHSNSGNFTTTIAEYLKTAGFGITTAVSSGKDVYIHFAVPEFLYAAQNDTRTKAVVLYVEPGGYYEKMALDWIENRLFGFTKPMVVCVTGRWKKGLERPCGHAGAMAGSGDDAESKEQWFDAYFGVPVFDPKTPKVSKRGVRVASIQHIPQAMREVFKKIDEPLDFEPTGDLSLKLWISDPFFKLPPELDIPIVQAIPPYDQQIAEINKFVGAHYIRQNMRNKSGASRIRPETQVAELHGKSVLELCTHSFEENAYFALAKVFPPSSIEKTMNLILNLFLKWAPHRFDLFEEARQNGATPNAMMAMVVAGLGNSPLVQQIQSYTHFMIEQIREYGIGDHTQQLPEALQQTISEQLFQKMPKDTDSEILGILKKELQQNTVSSPALVMFNEIEKLAEKEGLFIQNPIAFLLSSILLSIFWKPMMEKRMTRETVENASSYFFTLATISAHTVTCPRQNEFWAKIFQETSSMEQSFTDHLFQMIFQRVPSPAEKLEFKYLLGLSMTNGPGTLSAKGAKESVSAGNAIPTAFAGFLTNTGLVHGGNGFEAIEYLLEQFQGISLKDPGKKDPKLNLQELANRSAKAYFKYKQEQKAKENLQYKRIPCINHPVFKGKEVNIDPREEFVWKQWENAGIYNVFLDFYHHLVRELYHEGATENVFCVNLDAVLATTTLKLIWTDLQKGKLTLSQAREIAFYLFILGRALGISAEIADHMDRGEPMDCRTPENEVSFVL